MLTRSPVEIQPSTSWYTFAEKKINFQLPVALIFKANCLCASDARPRTPDVDLTANTTSLPCLRTLHTRSTVYTHHPSSVFPRNKRMVRILPNNMSQQNTLPPSNLVGLRHATDFSLCGAPPL